MGLVHSNSLATSVKAFKHLLFDIPESWSLEEAATVPVVYSTAYYALVVRGQLRKGETVLIHSGSGGVGQAAIAIALSYGCRVFTTVGKCLHTRQKKIVLPSSRISIAFKWNFWLFGSVRIVLFLFLFVCLFVFF